MKQGEKFVWLFVAALAAIVLLMEFVLVDGGVVKFALCTAALAVIGIALWKQRQDEPGKKRGGG